MSKKILIGIIIVVAIVVIAIVGYNLMRDAEVSLLNQSETLSTDEFDIKVNDFYNANYYYDKNSNFDKYVAVDLTITNNQDRLEGENLKINTLSSFSMADKNTNDENPPHIPVIDENYKKFSATLAPGEDFDITLTFGVDDSSDYILYYNKTLKSDDERMIGFKLDGNNLATKDVETTLEHELPTIGKDEEESNDENSSSESEESSDENSSSESEELSDEEGGNDE